MNHKERQIQDALDTLHSNGVPVEHIAQHLGVTVEEVNKVKNG